MERLTDRITNMETGKVLAYTLKREIHMIKGIDKLGAYEDAEEKGLLLRLPCDYNESLFWVVRGHIKEVWFKGIRCDKGYKPQIIARYMEGLSSKEEPITKLENIGKTVFLTREEAEQALKQMGECEDA